MKTQALMMVGLFASWLAGTACHAKPPIVTTSNAAIGGTIVGIVSGRDGVALGDRTVTIINIDSGQRFETSTGPNGGYSLRVPSGTYRLEVQLHDGETIADDTAAILLKNGSTDDASADVNAGRQ